VNDTSSNPDDRDGATVATGEHSPASVEQNGSGESHGANGSPRPSPRPATSEDTPVDGGEPVVEDAPDVPSAEAPTATMRRPDPDYDVTRPVDRNVLPQPAPAVPAQGGPRGPHTAPVPAGGPVPGPGPAAAPPPPWQRVPGPEQPPPQPERSRPAGGLLDDEGPTAFLEAPPPPGGAPSAPGQQNGAWSGVRAVRNRQPRQAALQLKRLDPWSVLKLALVLAVVLFFIWLVAVGVLYGVLDGMGVWDRLNGTYADLVSGEAPTGSPLISAGRVFGLAAVIGAINSLLFAVAITVGAFVYNVSADLVGGIEVTLSERD
jgi:Transmembrane domain of unknown function (DUF3566)